MFLQVSPGFQTDVATLGHLIGGQVSQPEF